MCVCCKRELGGGCFHIVVEDRAQCEHVLPGDLCWGCSGNSEIVWRTLAPRLAEINISVFAIRDYWAREVAA